MCRRKRQIITESSIEKRLRKSKPKKIYGVDLDFRFQTATGWEMENIPVVNGRRILMSPRHTRSFAALSEPLRLVIDRSLGRAPVDWELFQAF